MYYRVITYDVHGYVIPLAFARTLEAALLMAQRQAARLPYVDIEARVDGVWILTIDYKHEEE